MRSKGAIELSVNFLVIIIISMALLGFGITYLYKILKGAEDLSGMTLEDIDKQIADLKCDNTQKICIDKSILELEPKEFEVISIRILNVDPGDIFDVMVRRGIYVTPDNEVFYPLDPGFPYPYPFEVFPNQRELEIPLNEADTFGIGFEYQKAPKGTYVFDVEVYKRVGVGQQVYDIPQKIYIDVR